jgi:hypothetical protein
MSPNPSSYGLSLVACGARDEHLAPLVQVQIPLDALSHR